MNDLTWTGSGALDPLGDPLDVVLRAPQAPIGAEDITMVICVRAGTSNPWVIERLRQLPGSYDPMPRVLIVDFGSAEPFAATIAGICSKSGFGHVFVADYDTYSASRARNLSLQAVGTELIYFTDIDIVGASDFFAGLARAATIAGLPRVFDTVIDLPVYHLTEAVEQLYSEAPLPEQRDDLLDRVFFDGHFEAFGRLNEFIVPYSNSFLITKTFFMLAGGYDERFRGHGSEDFEFFVRAGLTSAFFPMPRGFRRDQYQPSRWSYFQDKQYEGFRRLNELYSARAQRMGLRVFHRWHPTSQDGEDWRSVNDWKRVRMNEAFDVYAEAPENLLGVDNFEREKTAVCVCLHGEHRGYFLPLRAAGYRLVPILDDGEETIAAMEALLDSGEVDVFAVFNPYMFSHRRVKGLWEMARAKGIQTLVVERGALPNTVYYATDVAYAGHEFSPEAMASLSVSAEERAKARRYIEGLRQGAHLLESADPRDQTEARLAEVLPDGGRRVFIPLQLDDDMAVTQFVREAQDYAGFVGGIGEVAAAHPETVFLVKPHPLSKRDLSDLPDNVIFLERSDNIHAILDLADAVVCYNSGVGLLAACHGTPLVTVGNAFYNLDGIGHRADNIEAAVALAAGEAAAPDPEAVTDLIAKYLFHRYSVFAAQDDIREFQARKAHGYRGIRVSRPVLLGETLDLVWEKSVRSCARKSFGFAEINPVTATFRRSNPSKDVLLRRNPVFWAYYFGYSRAARLSEEQRSQLRSSPSEVLARAQHPVSRLAKFLLRC